MRKVFFGVGILFLLSGVVLYQLVSNQVDDIEEFIRVEKAAGNIIEESTCELMIDNQCEVRGVEYGGRLIGVVNEMNNRMNNTKSLGRIFFVLGVGFVTYSIYRELSKVKHYLID